MRRALPESCCACSVALPMTDVRLDGIGNDGLGRVCIAAKACCTASWRTSGNKTINQKSLERPSILASPVFRSQWRYQ